jgi:uncharacterized protein YkwD
VAPAALGLLLLVSLAPAVSAVTMPSETEVAAAEAKALDLINTQRTDRGLVKLRLDARIATIARERAEYMAQTDVLSHEHAGGKMAWDLMTDAGVTWYGAGEIIAYNSTSVLTSSASTAVKGWLGSPPHKSIMLSTNYNYIGMGLAVSPTTGRRYWAGVFLKGPDRTGAWAKLGTVSKKTLSSTKVRVTLRWSGADTKLQVLTSGFRYFQTQRRVDGGDWIDYGVTTATSAPHNWVRGHTYQFRVRSRDKDGNWGAWKVVTVKT